VMQGKVNNFSLSFEKKLISHSCRAGWEGA
jgi:hypothetical protein